MCLFPFTVRNLLRGLIPRNLHAEDGGFLLPALARRAAAGLFYSRVWFTYSLGVRETKTESRMNKQNTCTSVGKSDVPFHSTRTAVMSRFPPQDYVYNFSMVWGVITRYIYVFCFNSG